MLDVKRELTRLLLLGILVLAKLEDSLQFKIIEIKLRRILTTIRTTN